MTSDLLKPPSSPRATAKVNVIPSSAEAYVNLRIHSAQSLQEVNGVPDWSRRQYPQRTGSPPSPLQVLHLIQSTVGDPRVGIELVYGFDPLPVSSSDDTSFGFQIIKKTVLEQFPTVTVAPGTTSTDR